jgi:hypothetical protein
VRVLRRLRTGSIGVRTAFHGDFTWLTCANTHSVTIRWMHSAIIAEIGSARIMALLAGIGRSKMLARWPCLPNAGSAAVLTSMNREKRAFMTNEERDDLKRAYIQAFRSECRTLSAEDIYELREQFYRAITGKDPSQ